MRFEIGIQNLYTTAEVLLVDVKLKKKPVFWPPPGTQRPTATVINFLDIIWLAVVPAQCR